MKRLLTCTLAGMLFAAPSFAAGEMRHEAPGHEFTLGLGYAWLEANELVYSDGDRISQLIWESDVPIVTLSGRIDLSPQWFLSSGLKLGFGGNSFMADYDWLTYAPSYAFDDWSHRSLHPVTTLDHYVDFELALGHDFELQDKLTLDLHAGLKYTNVQWTAYGGSFVYSTYGFRDDVFAMPDSMAGATYEQRMPGAFLGLGGEWREGNWTLSGHARGGVAFRVEAIDDHHYTDYRFTDSFDQMPFVSLAVRADYRIREQASLFVAGSYDHYFRQTGDELVYDNINDYGVNFPGGGGADFSAITLQAGFRIDF